MPQRTDQAQRLLASHDLATEFKPAHTPRTVDPRVLALALDRLLPADRNTVYDSGNFLQVVPYVQVQEPACMKLTADFSSIGMGFGTAMGYAAGAPQRPTVLFIGDGSFLMTRGELETVAREDGLPPISAMPMSDESGDRVRSAISRESSLATARSTGRKHPLNSTDAQPELYRYTVDLRSVCSPGRTRG